MKTNMSLDKLIDKMKTLLWTITANMRELVQVNAELELIIEAKGVNQMASASLGFK
jgi:hypothetical protein